MNRINAKAIEDGARLVVLDSIEQVYGDLARAHARTEARRDFLFAITSNAEHGEVALCCWSRDCDHVEASSRTLVAATAAAVDAEVERILDGAEGPTRFWIQAPSERFEHQSYDRIAEAHENGHAHTVSTNL